MKIFNITRWDHERSPTGRTTKEMKIFNKFIEEAAIQDLSLSNGLFSGSEREFQLPLLLTMDLWTILQRQSLWGSLSKLFGD